jgi:hypothetical protein
VHAVQVEVVLLSVTPDDQLRWRAVIGELGSGSRPDARARQLAGLDDGATGTVVHSTSWRAVASGLILTYAVLPDPHPAAGTARAVPADARIICSADPAAPCPPVVAIEHVLAHALRHLSLLARTDPALVAAIDTHPRLWDAVVARAPDVAGELVFS